VESSFDRADEGYPHRIADQSFLRHPSLRTWF
jgi:hypothetical protein